MAIFAYMLILGPVKLPQAAEFDFPHAEISITVLMIGQSSGSMQTL
jgi:hypothetical protein